jgi:hypothetical protein
MPRKAPSPFKRTGTHRLNCSRYDCSGYGYFTVANLEHALSEFGRLPMCACGEPFEPERFELADALDIDHAGSREYERRVDAKLQGQRPHVYRYNRTAPLSELRQRAMNELRAQEQETAHTRRVAALNRGTLTAAARAADTAADPIPF